MAKSGGSNKRILIDKANATVVIATSLAAFIVTFSIFATRTMLNQRAFQNKVITEKTIALKQLKENIKATSTLTESYKTFIEQSTNVIGGRSVGTGNQDGDNAKIILDALPSKYDFPAVVTSLEKLLISSNFTLSSIDGIDDELNQNENTTTGLIEIPFEAVITGKYAGIKESLTLFERSVRPFKIDSLSMSGAEQQMTLSVIGRTYYQPEKSLTIKTKDVQ